MITRHNAQRLVSLVGVVALSAAMTGWMGTATGCGGRQRGDSVRGGDQPRGSMPDRRIMLDGRFDDWPQGNAIAADGEYLYFRVAVEGGHAPLQASPETLALWIDADGRSQTGMRMPAPSAASGLGVDLIVQFSPRDGRERPRPGVVAYSVDGGGVRTLLGAGDIGLAAAPTFAAPEYEIRISRHPGANAQTLANVLRGRGRGSAMFVLSDSGGQMVGWSDPETFNLPSAAREGSTADVVVPPKAPGTLRVLSYNVHNSEPMKNPSAFARLIQVLDADVMLFQEWDVDPSTAQAWFSAVVTGERQWHAVAGANDVLIVSPYTVSALGPEEVMAEELPGGPSAGRGGEPRKVRIVGALVDTPLGPVAAASVHLKCCGTVGSSEDQRRIAEARTINAAFGSAIQQSGARLAVIGGDYNLVGSRTPLDLLRARIDLDGSELAVAEPMLLGDAAMITWRDDKTPFPPGRLDFMVFTDASAEVVNSFVLDTSKLSDRALARMGLDRTDTGASDHLPVVVDLRPR